MTNRVWRELGFRPETTLHDVRYGEEYNGEYVWVFEISGAVPPEHLIDGYTGAISERQPAMYFPARGRNVKGVSKPGEIVWSRVFVEDASSRRIWPGQGRRIAARGDGAPLADHNTAVADHARGHVWCFPRSDDGPPQGESHSGSLWTRCAGSGSCNGCQSGDVARPWHRGLRLRRQARTRETGLIYLRFQLLSGRAARGHSPPEATLRVGMIGTGAISWKHAEAYKNIGYEITVCTDIAEASGRKFAEANDAEFVRTYEEVCRHPKVDYVDVCTFPDFRLQPIKSAPKLKSTCRCRSLSRPTWKRRGK